MNIGHHIITDKWTTLEKLRKGALFQTKDGIVAVKSEYRYSNENLECECVLVASGEYTHFPNGNHEKVREIVLILQEGRS